MPTEHDFDQLLGLVGNVRLATIVHPDMQEDRSADIKRGHKASNKKPGRPPKRRRMFDWPKEVCVKIHQLMAQDTPIRDIAEELNLSKSSVGRYVKLVPKSWIDKWRQQE